MIRLQVSALRLTETYGLLELKEKLVWSVQLHGSHFSWHLQTWPNDIVLTAGSSNKCVYLEVEQNYAPSRERVKIVQKEMLY